MSAVSSPAMSIVQRLVEVEGHCPPVLLYGAPESEIGSVAETLVSGWLGTSEYAGGEWHRCVDVQLIRPQGKSSLIQLNQMREVSGSELESGVPALRFLRTPPLQHRHKVVWIAPAHRMVDRAAHSLLKSLEEPEPYSRVLLTTDSLGSVLPTIRSRSICVACRTNVERAGDAASEWLPVACNVVEPYRSRVLDSMRESADWDLSWSLHLSERWHDIAKEWAEASGEHERVACAWVGEIVAAFLLYSLASPQLCQYALASHRRILGNVTPPFVFDDLACRVLQEGIGT